MDAKLVVVGGNIRETEIPLDLPVTLGRSRGASVQLPHPLVSRYHCEIIEQEGRMMVRDLGSMNGTFVGNQRVTESVLHPGDLLTVGTVTFRVVRCSETSLACKREGALTGDARGTATPHADDTAFPLRPRQCAETEADEPKTEPQKRNHKTQN